MKSGDKVIVQYQKDGFPSLDLFYLTVKSVENNELSLFWYGDEYPTQFEFIDNKWIPVWEASDKFPKEGELVAVIVDGAVACLDVVLRRYPDVVVLQSRAFDVFHRSMACIPDVYGQDEAWISSDEHYILPVCSSEFVLNEGWE